MIFAPDTELALQAAAALVQAELPDPASLDAFVDQWSWTGSRRRDEAELQSVRELRPRLRELWALDEEGVAEVVNAVLQQTGALPQVVNHGTAGYHLHATRPEAPLADRMAVEAAMALVDVLRQGELRRLRGCAAPRCDHLLVDLTKNRSRRFCSDSCANRTNVAAFRARRTTVKGARHDAVR
ncbi:MAG: CGNR zinc finger domain-containing protein [Frankiales bacterium]|nr:CGNR zinc finger domain-containing protein [Frankiales bacterium]